MKTSATQCAQDRAIRYLDRSHSHNHGHNRSLGISYGATLVAAVALLLGCGAKDNTPMEDPSIDLEAARKRHSETLTAQTASGTANRESSGQPATFDAKLSAGDQLHAAGDVPRALWAYTQAL